MVQFSFAQIYDEVNVDDDAITMILMLLAKRYLTTKIALSSSNLTRYARSVFNIVHNKMAKRIFIIHEPRKTLFSVTDNYYIISFSSCRSMLL